MSDPFPHDFNSGSVGINFQLPSRRSFIPNAWLLHADLNRQATVLELHYTHCLVTIEGANLRQLHEHIGLFGVSCIEELRTAQPDKTSVTRIEISEKSED